jgi:hypothetical protein
MNRSLASKAVSKEAKAGSKAVDSRGRDSRVKNLDRVASTAVSKSRGNRVASAKLSAPSDDQSFPGFGRGFFSAREPFSSHDAR